MQVTPAGEVHWILETKGRVWEGTAAKDEAIAGWCKRVSDATGEAWRYARIDQPRFQSHGGQTLAGLTDVEAGL